MTLDARADCILPTTDRIHAEEALRSLESPGVPRPVMIVRNVRPLYASLLPTLECQMPYCLIEAFGYRFDDAG